MNPPRILDEASRSRLLLDTRPWLSCDDCFKQIDTYVEAIMRDASHDDLRMRIHLVGCPACAEEADGLLFLLTGESTPASESTESIQPEPNSRHER
jgi:hypothetical protein